jgi:hypothetical protein
VEQPVEKEERIAVVDVSGGFLVGILLATFCGMDHGEVLMGSSAAFTIVCYSLCNFLSCRFVVPPRFVLGLSVGLAIVGFWQMQKSTPDGSSHVAMAIGTAIGAMAARHVLLKKASRV